MKQLSILAIILTFLFTLLKVNAQPLLRIDLPDKAVPGEIITVLSRPSNFDYIGSLQFSLQWSIEDLELIEAVSALPQINANPDNGTLTASWYDANTISWPNDSTILTLYFKVKKCSDSQLNIYAYDSPLAAAISTLALGEEVHLPITSDTLQVYHKEIFTNQDSTICSENAVLLYANCNNCIYMWSTGETTDTIVVNTIGTYILEIKDTLNCIAKDTIYISNYPQQAIKISGDSLICAASTTDLIATTGFSHYAWSNGMIGHAINAGAGIYTLTATNTHGCTTTTQFIVNETSEVNALIDITPAVCEGEKAQIDIIAEGGFKPYEYQFENSSFSNHPVFQDIEPGAYSIKVRDSLGCEYAFSVDIDEPDIWVVEVNPHDTLIYMGDTVQLNIVSNQTVASTHWLTSTGISCLDCMNPFIIGSQSQLYQVEIVNQNGCLKTLEAKIEIKTDAVSSSIYIPNVFTPDTYGDNGYFKIFYDPTYVKTFNLTIFDRWGNMIAAPPQTSEGWNGYYNGNLMNTGVYIYVVQLEYIDGGKETLSGDITLLR
jgi:gliding motility-associated-like protein